MSATSSVAARDPSLPVRVASALLLAPLFLTVAYVGGWAFLGLVGLLVAAGSAEFFRLALPGERLALVVAVASGLALCVARYATPGGGWAAPAAVTLGLAGALALSLQASEPAVGARTAALAFLGTAYVGWLFSFLVGLRELPREVAVPYRGGFALLLAPLLLTWTSDVAAYFAGRAWGSRRLLPRVSPGKTVAGAVGALVVCAAAGALLFTWAPDPLPALGPIGGALAGAAASLLAQTGDLVESLLKRAFGVKDSGRLIPGHGGVLDRFDALLFTAPAAYFLFRVTLG